jgi:hypothetical protein|tara:strand:- start:104 stop:358 length:255 start_codon:yes stop_codon:yes gene_type:complete
MTARTFTSLDALDIMQALTERTTCPRCGIPGTMRRPVEVNALSRHTRGENDTPLYVCSTCGQGEAMEQAFATLLPVAKWVHPPT